MELYKAEAGHRRFFESGWYASHTLVESSFRWHCNEHGTGKVDRLHWRHWMFDKMIANFEYLVLLQDKSHLSCPLACISEEVEERYWWCHRHRSWIRMSTSVHGSELGWYQEFFQKLHITACFHRSHRISCFEALHRLWVRHILPWI